MMAAFAKNSPTSRLINLDLVRTIGMLLVVQLHVYSDLVYRRDFFATKLWFLMEPIVALSRTGVLLFFMLSGYLIINKKMNIRQNWKKTVERILIPFLFFSLVNIIFNFYYTNMSTFYWSNFLQKELIKSTSHLGSHLWFLPTLFFLYLLNPLWTLAFSRQKPHLSLCLVKGAFFFSIVTTVIKYPILKQETMFNIFTSWIGFACFYFYGAAIKKQIIKPINQFTSVGLIILGLALSMASDYFSLLNIINSNEFIWTGYAADYLSIPTIISAIGLFSFLMQINISQLKLNFYIYLQHFFEWMSGLSYGVYLLHPYIIKFLKDTIGFDFNKLNINIYIFNLLNICIVLTISLVLTLIIKSAPIFRKIIGE